MSDVRKAVLLAIMAAAVYFMCLAKALVYVGRSWRVLVYGPVGDNWPGVSNLAWFAMLFAGVVVGLIPVFLLVIRKIGRRESGAMLMETERGIRSGTLHGVDRLKEELEDE